ncbi:flagellar hook-associated protein FlgK [Novosphingobium sp. G106]|uniref:flagellar hook-associated protein FlgK n=1 Tax=Novosphingobium sp. G106 TaxID=2849500 RepID=UPI001C2D5A17|nr:flagellar hook-associated protein FlgK [Novosphingobium sp. G106]MBV1690698.1 flagellar hook-associated protein FlgK [Novosphingobium sp. G106]
MASDLLGIGKSGAIAARIALDVTAQNITNASTDGYVRRSVQLAEASASGGYGRVGDVSLSGVRLDKVVRNADMFRQSEVRRTGADAARADAEVTGLQNIEDALEQSGAYDAVVKFEGSLQQLASDPTDTALRASVVESARTMTRTMNIAAQSLDQAGQGLQFEATDGVNQVNTLAAELGRVNLRLARAADASSDQTTLLDQRDSLLEKLSQYTDVTTTFAADDTVTVTMGGSPGQTLVAGGTASPLAMTISPTDGTLSFTVGGNAVTPVGGSLAGKSQALVKLDEIRTGLDAIAKSVADTVNGAQANGVDLAGVDGTPMFNGTTAATIGLAFSDGSKIATAPKATPPAVTPPNSRDQTNLAALQTALQSADPAGKTDSLIFNISSAVQGRTVTRDALESIANTAKITLSAQAGVSLDNEAANLVRYQQAFQASGRIMQVAQDTFNSILSLK